MSELRLWSIFWSVGLLIRRFNPPKDVELFCASRSEVCPRVPTYSNAHAKVKKWIFKIHFPGNWSKFGINVNDF